MWPTYYMPSQLVPTLTPPGYHDNGCGLSTFFTPTNIPGLRVGDFMVWICVTNVGRTWAYQAALAVPPGWSVYASDPGRRNWNNSGAVIFYKWATAADLDPTTEYEAAFVNNPEGSAPYRVCSVTYAYRDIHPHLPFGSTNVSRGSGSADWRYLESLFMHVGHDQAPVILIAGSRTYNSSSSVSAWGLQSVQPLGPPLSNEVRFQLLYEVDPGFNSFYIGRRIASNTEGENWIPNETAFTSCNGSGWTDFAMTSRLMSGYHCRLKPGGFGAGRHYIERSVSLTAGETYTFHLSRRGPWNTGYEGAVGISYVDPDGNERGFIQHSSTKLGGILDPLSDLSPIVTDMYGVWTYRVRGEQEDGVPSTTGATPVLIFTAQETGVHKLRISVARVGWTGSVYNYYWEFTSATGEYRDVRGVCFRRGNTPIYFQPTPNDTAVMAGDKVNGAVASCWDKFSFSDPNVTCPGGVSNHQHLALNYNVALTPAVMETFVNWGDITGLVEANTVFPTYVTSDDAACAAISSRPVMPYKEDQYGDMVLAKYYFEVTLLNAKNFYLGVQLGSFGAGAGYYYDTRSGRGYIPNADASWIATGTPVAPVIGDVWGVMVNYVDKEVEFFRNGTSVGVIAMLDTYGVANATNSGKTGWDWPCYAYVYNDVGPWPRQVAYLKVNLAGPFVHQPAGTYAFDWIGG